jgi:hypothetical protein
MQKCAAGPELTAEPGEQRRGLPSVIEEAPRQLKRRWRSRLRRRRARRKPAPAKRCREPRLRRHWPDLPIREPAVSRNGAAWSLSVTVALGDMAPQGSGGSALCRLPRRWPPVSRCTILRPGARSYQYRVSAGKSTGRGLRCGLFRVIPGTCTGRTSSDSMA